jgi:methyl-accepting chemotaxis protein
MGREKRRKFYQREIELYRSLFTFFILAGAGAAILAAFYMFFASAFVDLIVNKSDSTSVIGPVSLLGDVLTGIWVYAIIGSILLLILASLFTHRFAGPLYRFEVSLDQMINGDLSFNIVLRKKDECKTLADKINRFNSGLSSNLKTMTAIAGEIEAQHKKLKEQYGSDDILLHAVKANTKMKDILSGYKLNRS